MKDKRKDRIHKKLKTGRWSRWDFFIHFDYDMDFESDKMGMLIDTVYEISEKYDCCLMGGFDNGKAKLMFNNTKLLDSGVSCQKEMADFLLVSDGVSSVQVSFTTDSEY